MIDTIGQWLVTIPVDNPWRAIVLVLLVLAIAFILHMLWELGFMVASGLNRKIAKLKSVRSVPIANPSVVMSIKSDKVEQI